MAPNPTSARSKFWCFTINNPDFSAHPDQDPNRWKDVEFCVYQKEKGLSGTPHLQGYVGFQVRKRFRSVHRMCLTAHFEPRRGTHAQALAYVTKKETRLDEPVYIGTVPSATQGLIEQLKLSEDFVVEYHGHSHWSVFGDDTLVDFSDESDNDTIYYLSDEEPEEEARVVIDLTQDE